MSLRTLFYDDATGKTVAQNVVGVNSYQFAFDPVPGDDITSGYIVGDQWINNISDEIFVCVDNTASAAVWKSITDSSGSIPVASNTFVFTAAENIPAYSPVTTSGLIPSSSNILHAPLIAGVAIATTSTGNSGNYQFAGIMVNAAWSFSVGPVYLNGNVISNTPPTNGFVKLIGRAVSATRIMVDVGIDYYIVQPIDLNFGNSRSVSITHNMKKNPDVLIRDMSGFEVNLEVQYPDLNTVVITSNIDFIGGVIIK